MKLIFVLFVLMANCCFSQVDLKHGLRLYYPFSGNANDVSGNNNNPVFNNATLTADRFGNPKSAYHFNGKNTYMEILNNPSINMGNKMSISLWVKPMGFYTGRCYNNMMLMKGDLDYLQGNYSLRFADPYTDCTIPSYKQEIFYDATGSVATSPLVKLNQWYHVTVTYDGKTSRLYINCVLQASSPTSVSFKNAYDLYIGHMNSDQYPYWLNGDLDEIRIYDRALNKHEILALCDYKPEVIKPEYVKKNDNEVNLKLGLRAYYPFSGNANDISENKNNPVFNNATLTTDRFGNPKSAYHFNGKNNYIRIPNSSSLNMGKKMSISLWVKPTKFYTGPCYNNMLLTKSATTTLPSNYYLRFADVYTGCDAPKTTSERFTGNNAIAATPVIKLNQWYNVVYTSDGTTEKIYVNCELKGSVPAGGVPFSNSYDMFFGCQNFAQYPYWLNGDLDEIRIYDRALNKEEILSLCDYKPEVVTPEYVKVKEKKNKDISNPGKDVLKPATAKETSPLTSYNDPAILNQGFIDPLPFEKQKEIVLQERKNEMIKEITVDNDSISVTLYDNGIVDGDSITLIYNDRILTTHQLLTEKPVSFLIKITPGNSRNELVMYAENLGSIPPNTALMIIYDGEKRYEVNIKSTEKTNGAVSFKLRE